MLKETVTLYVREWLKANNYKLDTGFVWQGTSRKILILIMEFIKKQTGQDADKNDVLIVLKEQGFEIFGEPIRVEPETQKKNDKMMILFGGKGVSFKFRIENTDIKVDHTWGDPKIPGVDDLIKGSIRNLLESYNVNIEGESLDITVSIQRIE